MGIVDWVRGRRFVTLTAWLVASAAPLFLAGCSSTGSSSPNDFGTDGASPSDGATGDTGTGTASDGAGRDGGGDGGQLEAGDGGQLEAGDGPSGKWNCLDAPPDLCFCNLEPTEGGVTECSPGFACCFATATSCECADQESCDFAAAIGAHPVTKCPPE